MSERVSNVLVAISGMWQRNSFALRSAGASFFVYVPRALNAAADFLVNQALDTEHSYIRFFDAAKNFDPDMLLAIRGFSDGG